MKSRRTGVACTLDAHEIEVVAPNFKRRLSGVTSTIIQLVPEQNRLGRKVAVLGPGLPDTLPRLRWRDLAALRKVPTWGRFRVWHARRNVEMLPAIILRDVFRFPLKLVFTSASQRPHTAYTKWLIRRMDAVIATSSRTGNYLEVPYDVVLHGIETQRFRPADDKAIAKSSLGLEASQQFVGCFGRVRPQKGTDLFVDAMIELLPHHPGWSALVAGRATSAHKAFEDGLKARVAAAGLSQRILFVGEHRDIERWYKVLSLYVAPQRWEGFGLTPLEAMASGVPVVAADVGAFRELIPTGHLEAGIVTQADQVDALVHACGLLMDNEARRLAAAQYARQHVDSHFSIENEARALDAIYRRLGVAGPPAIPDKPIVDRPPVSQPAKDI